MTNTSITTLQVGGSTDQTPSGFSNKPKPGGDPTPYFLSENDAAIYWTNKLRPIAMARNVAVEFSSEIRSITVKSGKSSILLYYSTPPARYPDAGSSIIIVSANKLTDSLKSHYKHTYPDVIVLRNSIPFDKIMEVFLSDLLPK